jgi:Fe-S cluster biogenesis protein NfuA
VSDRIADHELDAGGTGVERVIDLMNGMVARDGGRVSLRSYDPVARSLVVDYDTRPNPDCETCSINAETLELFLAESLRSHGIAIDELTVAEPS